MHLKGVCLLHDATQSRYLSSVNVAFFSSHACFIHVEAGGVGAIYLPY